MARARVPTGIHGLDPLIGGGFQEGKTYLVAGGTGTGKSILCMQYLLGGIARGEPGVYVTVDEKPRHLIEDAASLNWDLEKHIDESLLKIVDISPYFLDIRVRRPDIREVGEINCPGIVSELARHIREIGAKRIVLDPLAPLVTTAETEQVVRDYIRGLIFSIDDTLGVTTLCSSEIPTGTKRLSRYGVEEFLVSGVIVLGFRRTGSVFNRLIYIRKMRGTPIDLSIYGYGIQRDKGIIITSITLQ